MQSSSPKIEEGDIVVCPKCKSKIAIVKRDIFPGEIISAVDFAWKNGERFADGDVMSCRDCFTPFAKEGVYGPGVFVHTDKGWRPDMRH